ncbi:hypothetical protein [Streptomyces sp. B21-083]|uniref:hypothetical protein n=1 Tax=Streptomyces sp. B21-083 TaxID=3039410 RepID=UPI002FF05F2A
MRRTIRRHATLALPVLTLTIALAGCADRSDSGRDGGSSVSAPSTASTSPNTSASPTPSPAGCAATTTLGARDSGRTVCLTVGDTVRISLDGTSERPWKPLTASGAGLEAANSGVVLRAGDASAAFKAVSAGRTRLESTRPLCAAARPGQVSCRGIQEWWVAVVVK